MDYYIASVIDSPGSEFVFFQSYTAKKLYQTNYSRTLKMEIKHKAEQLTSQARVSNSGKESDDSYARAFQSTPSDACAS